MAVNVTMVDKDGNEWLAGDATEVNDLLAQGYRFKGQGPGPEGLTSGTEKPGKSKTDGVSK